MLAGGAIAVLVVSSLIVVFGTRMGGTTSGRAPSSPSSSTSASASLSKIEAKEADLAKKKNWKEGKDYIASQPVQGQTVIDSIPALNDASGMALGPADAPVKVRVFGDFSCPVCTMLHKQSMPTLEKMAREGKIRLEWRNFPIFAQYGSDKAARGSIAAGAQGKLWEYLKAVYDAAGEGNHPTYTDESVRALAESAGLDMARFDADYNSEATSEALEQEQSRAQSWGLRGTPTILVGYAYAEGAAPTKMLVNTIELQADLAKK